MSLTDQYVARVKIAMNPERRSSPWRRVHQLVPEVKQRGAVDECLELPDAVVHRLRAIRQRHASHVVTRGVARSSLMKRTEECAKLDGRSCRIVRRCDRCA